MKKSDRDPISVKDIAEMAGVSVATVSRVINQNGRFSKETEMRVREIMEKYDFHPNQLARGLRVKKAKVIGILVPDITNEYFAKITMQIQKRLLKRDYLTLICNTNEDTELEIKQINMLKGQHVGGIIYVAANSEEKITVDMPVVYIDRLPKWEDSKTPVLISSDNRSGGYLATKALLDSGARHIACIAYKQNISAHADRVAGYLDAMHEAGLKETVFTVDKIDEFASAQALRRIWMDGRETDGVFCTTDILAVGCMQFCAAFGISIPTKMKIVGYDDLNMCEFLDITLSSVKQDVEQFADIAVSSILTLIDGGIPEKKIYKLPVQLKKRLTLG